MLQHTILAIEPDPLFQNYLKELLAGKFELVCVASFSEGKQHLKDGKADCALLSDEIPDGELWEIMDWLKGNDIPAVMVVGTSDDRLAVEATRLGALDYLSKESLAPRAFQNCLHHVIDLHEAQRREAMRQEDLSSFVATAAHDLTSPLMVINGQVELMKMGIDDGETKEELMEYAAEIQSTTTGLLDFIGTLLEHTKTARELDVKTVPFKEVMDTVLGRLRTHIDNSAATIKLQPDPLPEVKGDPVWLEQLMQNLVGNAMKYCKPDVPPEITVEVEEDPSNSEYRVHVEDNGLGIPEEFHMKIFRPLERGPFREQSGFGIGLATCQRIVERHKGQIWLKSETGVGSTFSFSLPMQAKG